MSYVANNLGNYNLIQNLVLLTKAVKLKLISSPLNILTIGAKWTCQAGRVRVDTGFLHVSEWVDWLS